MRLAQGFEIRVLIDDGADPNRPRVQIVVDGEDLWPDENNIGYDPGDLLRSPSPLLPSEVPRRVAIYRCSCGETGCGSIAPIISADDDFVYWSEFQDFVGVFARADDSPNASGGKAVPVQDMKFAKSVYEAEVERASADDSWMSEDRKTGMLLEAGLNEHAEYFESLGYRPRSVSTWRTDGQTEVHFFHHVSGDLSLLYSEPRETREERQVYLRNNAGAAVLLSSSGTPEDRAAYMLQFLLITPPSEWPRPEGRSL